MPTPQQETDERIRKLCNLCASLAKQPSNTDLVSGINLLLKEEPPISALHMSTVTYTSRDLNDAALHSLALANAYALLILRQSDIDSQYLRMFGSLSEDEKEILKKNEGSVSDLTYHQTCLREALDDPARYLALYNGRPVPQTNLFFFAVQHPEVTLDTLKFLLKKQHAAQQIVIHAEESCATPASATIPQKFSTKEQIRLTCSALARITQKECEGKKEYFLNYLITHSCFPISTTYSALNDLLKTDTQHFSIEHERRIKEEIPIMTRVVVLSVLHSLLTDSKDFTKSTTDSAMHKEILELCAKHKDILLKKLSTFGKDDHQVVQALQSNGALLQILTMPVHHLGLFSKTSAQSAEAIGSLLRNQFPAAFGLAPCKRVPVR